MRVGQGICGFVCLCVCPSQRIINCGCLVQNHHHHSHSSPDPIRPLLHNYASVQMRLWLASCLHHPYHHTPCMLAAVALRLRGTEAIYARALCFFTSTYNTTHKVDTYGKRGGDVRWAIVWRIPTLMSSTHKRLLYRADASLAVGRGHIPLISGG